MSDAITIQYDDAAVLARLQKLAEAASAARMRTVFMEIGEDLAESTKRRFETSSGPDGQRWAPLKPGTVLAALSKMRGVHSKRTGQMTAKGAKAVANRKPLVDTGTLAGQIHYRLTPNSVEIGTNRFAGEWKGGAAVHQFGGKPHAIVPRNKKALAFNGVVVKKVNHPGIPARPFLGLSADDKVTVLDILQRHFREATMK